MRFQENFTYFDVSQASSDNYGLVCAVCL